ncbi:hypothetical protein HYV31_00995 [candidate division WWE3 bacterium]|nr:hypothetical protein [candidate division WWE3 bacterium]
MNPTSQNSQTKIVNMVFTLLLIAGLAFLINLTNTNSSLIADDTSTKNERLTTEIEDGKQIVKLTAKVGYSPTKSIAKANTPSILRVTTMGTFDCSTSLTIPSLRVLRNLPPTGTTDIEIPPQEAGSILRGTCSMGMYNFSIKFI